MLDLFILKCLSLMIRVKDLAWKKNLAKPWIFAFVSIGVSLANRWKLKLGSFWKVWERGCLWRFRWGLRKTQGLVGLLIPIVPEAWGAEVAAGIQRESFLGKAKVKGQSQSESRNGSCPEESERRSIWLYSFLPGSFAWTPYRLNPVGTKQ